MKKHTNLLRLYQYAKRAIMVVVWSLRKAIWRRLRNQPIKNYLTTHPIAKLQIGAERNVIEGWLNTDYDIRLYKNLVFLDATEPFPFANNLFDYVFHEHFIEHLTSEEGKKTLAECFRVLKPGGKIRIATPDLTFITQLITNHPTETQKKFTETSIKIFLPNQKNINPAYVVNNCFYAWGHKFIYDEYTLTKVLQDVGFSKIIRCTLKESSDENLINLESHGDFYNAETNKMQTMIIEAQKI